MEKIENTIVEKKIQRRIKKQKFIFFSNIFALFIRMQCLLRCYEEIWLNLFTCVVVSKQMRRYVVFELETIESTVRIFSIFRIIFGVIRFVLHLLFVGTVIWNHKQYICSIVFRSILVMSSV